MVRSPPDESTNIVPDESTNIVPLSVPLASQKDLYLDLVRLLPYITPETFVGFNLYSRIAKVISSARVGDDELTQIELMQIFNEIKQYMQDSSKIFDRQSKAREVLKLLLKGIIVSAGYVCYLSIDIDGWGTAKKHLRRLERMGLIEKYPTDLVVNAIPNSIVVLDEADLWGIPGLGKEAYLPYIEWCRENTRKARKRSKLKSKKKLDKLDLERRIAPKDLVNERNRVLDQIEHYDRLHKHYYYELRGESNKREGVLYKEKADSLREKLKKLNKKIEEGEI